MKRIFISAIATIIMFIVMNKQGQPIKTSATPLGIVSVELANNFNEATTMVKAAGKSNLKTNTYLDFLFIAAYASFLYFCCKQVIGHYSKRQMIWLGYFFLELSLATGALDILENICLLILFSGKGSDLSVVITHWAAILKFAAAILTISYLIFSFFGLKIFSNKTKQS